jgi:hypothetical protein
MNEADLRRRFEELRDVERGAAPPFVVAHRPARRWAPLAVAALLLIVTVAAAVLATRSHRTVFTADDRVAARAIAAWHPPTEFLLRTPGSELLTSTPSIPDAAARSLVESAKGVSR